MKNIVITAILIIVLALSIGYIVKAQKSGAKCIGCPSSKDCGSKSSNSSCNCGCHNCNPDTE